MTGRSLKKLGKVDLLKLLREQELELERLTRQAEDLNREIEELKLQRSSIPNYVISLDNEPISAYNPGNQPAQERIVVGSIAQSALKMQDVFGATQRAADQYLDEIKAMYEQSSHMMELREAEAMKKAEDIISRARLESEKYHCDRTRLADEVWHDVQSRWDSYLLAHKDLQEMMGDTLMLPKIDIKSRDAE